MQLIASCLLFVASLWNVRAINVAGSPFEKTMNDVISLQKSDTKRAGPLRRHIRSSTGGIPCLTVPYLAELQSRFKTLFDHNNDGVADFDEMKNYLRKFKPNLDDETVEAFIGRRDMNDNGAMDFIPDYVNDMSKPDYTPEAAAEWFQLQDMDDSGKITAKELLHTALAHGMSPKMAEGTVNEYYMARDMDKDGQLNFDEFKTLYAERR